MASKKLVLVCGATGQQGGSVARSLLAKGQRVRCLTRTPEKARGLLDLGAEVVRGEFDDAGSLHDALRGVDGVFLVGTPFEKGVDAETEQGKAVINACWKQSRPYVVYSSVCSANKHTGIPHFESKYAVEEHLKGSGLQYTIFRPVFFMENFESPWLLPSILDGVLRSPLRPDRPLQMVCLHDIGEFCAAAFLHTDEFLEKEIDIAADKLTLTNAAARIARALGRPVRYEHIPEEKAEETVGHDFSLMYKWFNEKGYNVDIGELRHYGIALTNFQEYLDYSKKFGKKAA